MTFGKKKIAAIATGAVLAGAAACGGLVWWQLQAFDKLTGMPEAKRIGLFTIERVKSEAGLFHREVTLEIGLRLDDYRETLLVMNGRFTPGLTPSVTFRPEPAASPEAGIFVKADPAARIAFNALMHPREAEIHWQGAREGAEAVGDGRIAADFDWDASQGIMKRFAVTGRLGASESRTDDAVVSISEKTFDYAYDEAGRELNFSYKSGADALAGVQMPVSLGPYSYSLSIAPEGVNNVMRNATELAFELRDVAINEEGIPPFDLRFKGRLSTPSNVWLPCLSGHLLMGSFVTDIPGICPAGSETDLFAAAAQADALGTIEDLTLAWRGASVSAKGEFNRDLAQKDVYARFDVTAAFDEDSQADGHSLAARELTRELLSIAQALEAEGGASQKDARTYETTIELAVSPDGDMKLTANGMDLNDSNALFGDDELPVAPDELIITVTPTGEPYVSKGVEDDLVAPIEEVLRKLEAVKRWSSVLGEDGTVVLHVTIEDQDRAREVIEALDARLTTLKAQAGEAVDIVLQTAIDDMPQFEAHPVENGQQ